MQLFPEYHNYTKNFNCPHIPTRMKNAISAELNSEAVGAGKSILPIPEGVNCKELIPNWLIILWVEMGLLEKVPNIGKKSINDTLQAIADCLSVEKQIVLKPE